MNRSKAIDRFKALLSRCFPDNAEIALREENAAKLGGDAHFFVNWKLNNDQRRPGKISIPVIVIFSQSFLDDYPNDEESRYATDDNVERFLRAKFADFDPDHNIPVGIMPNPVNWTISSQLNVYNK